MTASILTSIAPYVISLVTIVGLIVLMALGTLYRWYRNSNCLITSWSTCWNKCW